MTNKEYYKENLKELVVSIDTITKGCSFITQNILPQYDITCDDVGCGTCTLLSILWLEEEHKEENINWSKVPIDTKVLVRNEKGEVWKRRHYAGETDISGYPFVYKGGRTSFTGDMFDNEVYNYTEIYIPEKCIEEIEDEN